jgi:hypothetical protein
MNDTITCPHCGKSIPLTQALSHQVQEKYQKFYKIRLEEEKQKMSVLLKDEAVKKAKKEVDLQLKDKSNELEELKKQNNNFQEQLLELNKTLRHLRTSMEEEKLNLEKRLVNEQNKIRQDEQKKFENQYKLKFLEIEKQNEDLKKSLEEARRKAEQGSQQLQGEVQELELEKILAQEFPHDEIKEVPKGIKGADAIQIVKNNSDKVCGTIIWESKRTKSWSEGWVRKLKEDQRQINADIAVIITDILPKGIKNFSFKDNIWICSNSLAIGLAVALRINLISLFSSKLSHVGIQEKKDILWNYLNGTQFKQRIEAISDVYNQMQEEMEIEKRWFNKKWAKQEKNIRQVLDNVTAMDGDLRGIMGRKLPEPLKQTKLDKANQNE